MISNLVSNKKNSNKNVRIILFLLYIIVSPLNVLTFSSQFSIMKFISLFIIILYIVFSFNKKILSSSFNKPKKIWLMLFIYYAFSIIWCNYFDKTVTNVISMMETMIFAFILTSETFDQYWLTKIEYSFLISGYIMFFILIFNGTLDSTSRMVLNSKNLLADGNEINTYFLMPLIISVKNLLTKKKKIISLCIYFLTIIMCFYVDLVTGSRSGIIGLIVALILSIVIFGKLSIKKCFFILSVGLLLYLVITKVVFANLPIEVLERYQFSNMIEDKGSDRLVIWKQMFWYLNEDKIRYLIGFGRGGILNFQRAAHNVFLQELVFGGLIGLLLFMSFIFSLLANSKKNKNHTAYIGVVSSIFMFMFLSLNSSNKIIWIIFMFSLLSIKPGDACYEN